MTWTKDDGTQRKLWGICVVNMYLTRLSDKIRIRSERKGKVNDKYE